MSASLNRVLLLCTLFAFGFAAWVAWDGHQAVTFLMFGASPFVLIYMVLRVLKDPHPTDLTFDEQFYEDYDPNRSEY